MRNPIWNYLYPKIDEQPVKDEALRGLPASWYRSKNLYELERRAIFSKHWLLVSHKLRFVKDGDWVKFDQAGYHFFVVRKRDGQFKAFHNVCRRRGFPIVTKEEGCSRIFSCQYHAWSYNLDGKLTKAPGYQELPNFEPVKNNLFPIHVHIDHNGFIWVNLDAQDTPEIAWTDEFEGVDTQARFAPFNFEDFKFDHTWGMSGDYNWKTLADNYNECYHCKTAHPDVSGVADLDKYDVDMKDSHIQHCVQPRAEEFRDSAILRIASTFYFPNACMTVSPHFFYMMRCVPTSEKHCDMQYEVYRHKDASDAEFEEISMMFKRILTEDKWLCNNTQKNLETGVFVSGEMHPRMEKGPLYLQDRVRHILQNHHKQEKMLGAEIWPARQKLPANAKTNEWDEQFCQELDGCPNTPELEW